MNAFKFGAPPHGGLAYGLDHLLFWKNFRYSLGVICFCLRKVALKRATVENPLSSAILVTGVSVVISILSANQMFWVLPYDKDTTINEKNHIKVGF